MGTFKVNRGNRNSKIERIREHQANERTFLAWLRTSLALIGFGFAIARFSLFLRQLQATVTQRESVQNPFFNSETLGVALVVFGVIVIILAAWRYNQIFWQIEQGNYYPNRLLVWLLAGVVAVLGTLSIPVVLWRSHSRHTTSPIKTESQP